ncbi:hypothetical protein [Rasiella sp. SM2506]|uniref:hypothetical protein n=1 Tax=Rasiella sp. SM2506 TaxID=3423914 RepID=UPI003D78B9CE
MKNNKMSATCPNPMEANVETITYLDQNNNRYLITQDSFQYFPITEKESSSGTYNGGDPVSKKINITKFSEIQKAGEVMVKTSSVLIRRMTTSALTIRRPQLTGSYILQKSNERNLFESLLLELKGASE